MKKVISVLLCLSLMLSLAALLSGCGKSYDATIKVYNWGEYIDLTVIEEFEEKYNINVEYTTFDSNEALYSKVTTGAADYDVIIPSDYMISKLIKEDLLAELNFENIPNYQYISEDCKGQAYDPENKFSVPYTWGTTAILYNDEYVDAADVEAQSIDLLWNEKYSGNILMFDNPRDAFGLALKKLGYSMNSGNAEEWNAAAEELRTQKPLVQAYVMDRIFDLMESGEAWIAPYYAGDALTISANNEHVQFYIPKEGANIFVDAMCVLKSSENKDAAEKFINFMCETDIAVRNAEEIGYATPHNEAFKQLDPTLTGDKRVYPDAATKANMEVFYDLPADILTLQGDLWRQLKITSEEG